MSFYLVYLSIIMRLQALSPCIFIDAGLSGCPECFPELPSVGLLEISWVALTCIYTHYHIRYDYISTLMCSITCYLSTMNSRWCAGWSRSRVVIDYLNALGCFVAGFNKSPHRRQLFFFLTTYFPTAIATFVSKQLESHQTIPHVLLTLFQRYLGEAWQK